MPRHNIHAPRDGCTHDTSELPPGGYYFAPGSIDNDKPRRTLARRILAALAEVLILLAIAASLGVASGWLHAKGLM